MKTPLRVFFAVLLALSQGASANLVSDPTFTGVSFTGSTTTTPGLTVLYGQFGSDPTGSPANGSQLSISGWDTGGYNFVYAPTSTGTTADLGTQAAGAASGQPLEAPGQFTVTQGGHQYGNTFMWGLNNSGNNAITAPPGGGNFVAADGAYEVGAITQTVTGLTIGQTYKLTFYWGAAQQQSFSGATTDNWTVSLGPGSGTTSTYTLGSEDFSGWMQQTFYYTANATSETLSFLAAGTPGGEPPFALLADVDLEVAPDYSNWAIFGGFGAVCIFFEMLRRRRRKLRLAPA